MSLGATTHLLFILLCIIDALPTVKLFDRPKQMVTACCNALHVWCITITKLKRNTYIPTTSFKDYGHDERICKQNEAAKRSLKRIEPMLPIR